MKKLLAIAMSVLMLVLCMAVVASAEEEATDEVVTVEYPTASVTVNGDRVGCEAYGQGAVIIDGRTLVPLRSIFEVIGATVEWNQETKTSTSTRGDITVEVTLGSNVMKKNGADVTLDVPAQIINDRTLVPVRAITEAFGGTITWDAATRVAAIVIDGVEKPVELLNADADAWDLSDGIAHGLAPDTEVFIKENPLDPSDKVFYVDGITPDRKAWQYILFSGIEWEAGKKYLISYNFLGGVDNYKELPNGSSIGTNVKNDGDLNVYSGVEFDHTEWVNVTIAYTIPEDAFIFGDEFGIYANPITVEGVECGYNFYVDNVIIREFIGPDTGEDARGREGVGGTLVLDAAWYGIATK